ncbi:transposase [Glycomyces rhizosphaerae]|uniref:Transposase n=1 Tax=Glycomyces rhizosphaerae TaxID=2054422 RepID=A0ABV7Q1B3_9ACTN
MVEQELADDEGLEDAVVQRKAGGAVEVTEDAVGREGAQHPIAGERGGAQGARESFGEDRLHRLLLSELHALNEFDWSAICLDGSHIRAGGEGTGPSPVDRGRAGTKHHIACDSAGIPLAIITTAGNVPDIKAAHDLVEAIPPVAGRVGRPRRRPDAILADGGYDSRAFRDWLRSKRIETIIPQRGRKKIIGLGTIRWSSSRPSPTFTSSNALSSAGTGTCSCMKASPNSPPHSSAGDDLHGADSV